MKTLALAALVVAVSVAQVTVAPLFPLGGAVADFGLLTLVWLGLARGPMTVMTTVPILALLLGLTTDRAPGLLLIGYLPLLPLGAYLERTALPLNRYARVTAATVGTGLWVRLLLAFGAIAQGAEPQGRELLGDVLLPGLLFDWALFTIVYFPSRLLGWSPVSMTLRRGGY